ncbi:MAG: carboxylesterase family protein [Rhodanobacter sp.]
MSELLAFRPVGHVSGARTVLAMWLLCAAAVTHATEPPPPRVQLADGWIEGKRASAAGMVLDEFHGIPYVAPPLGALRWRPPQPVKPWRNVLQAKQFGPRCMQLPLFGDMVFRSRGMSEDCLYLNVWKPARGNGKLPVLVYFYGGGFVAGDGSENRYDGASLASKGIVTITVNYRLGVFGFFALPALADESPRHAAGNYGLLDQVSALRWVRANIGRFGGDPSQVTIAGESAGSIAVSALVASPLSRHLFARAIGESGAQIAPIETLSLARMEQQGNAFTRTLGVDSLNALRALPADRLLQATREQNGDADVDLDGWFLREPPAITMAQGKQAQVPLLLGSNSQEDFYTAILKKHPPTPTNYRVALKRLFGTQADEALTLYPGADEAQVQQSATALAADMFIAHTTWRWMDLQRQHSDAPVYFYYFAQPRPAKRHPVPGEQVDAGAAHSGEIEYALGNLASNQVYAWTAADKRTSATMEGYFAQFIKTGNPNGASLPPWPAVRESDGGILRQVIAAHTRTEVDRGAARQAFLQRFFRNHPDPL